MEARPEGASFPPPKNILSLSSPAWTKRLFEVFIDAIEVGVFVLDCKGTISRVNTYLLEQYQWNPEELIGKNLFEFLPDLAELGVEQRFHQIIIDRQVMELSNIRRKDRFGHDLIFNVKGMPIIENDDIIGVLAIMNDITERCALESQMAEAEEYLQNLIDNANDIIYTLDPDGYITFLNKMGQQVTGYKFVKGEKAQYSLYVPRNTLSKHDKHFREAMRGQPQRYESSILSDDGRIVNVLINITPIRKGDAVVGTLGIARDITERKRMEAQLLQAGKMAAIGELAAGVAHEINNPVGIISGTAEQLLFLINYYRERPAEVSEKLEKHVEIIREQALRCKKITQGLLNFARETETVRTSVNLHKLLEEMIALVGNRAMSEGKYLKLKIAPDVPILHADSNQLEQVFLNLVNNGLDAVDKYGTVSLHAQRKEDFIVIEVIDDGIGIPEANLKRIFDPFFTTKPIGKGTGLGLSICFGIIQSMNGSISVTSKPQGGTTFTVQLPIENGTKHE